MANEQEKYYLNWPQTRQRTDGAVRCAPAPLRDCEVEPPPRRSVQRFLTNWHQNYHRFTPRSEPEDSKRARHRHFYIRVYLPHCPHSWDIGSAIYPAAAEGRVWYIHTRILFRHKKGKQLCAETGDHHLKKKIKGGRKEGKEWASKQVKQLKKRVKFLSCNFSAMWRHTLREVEGRLCGKERNRRVEAKAGLLEERGKDGGEAGRCYQGTIIYMFKHITKKPIILNTD